MKRNGDVFDVWVMLLSCYQLVLAVRVQCTCVNLLEHVWGSYQFIWCYPSPLKCINIGVRLLCIVLWKIFNERILEESFSFNSLSVLSSIFFLFRFYISVIENSKISESFSIFRISQYFLGDYFDHCISHKFLFEVINIYLWSFWMPEQKPDSAQWLSFPFLGV